MRSYSPAELTYLQSRNGFKACALLWARPRDTATNLRVTVGFWTGEQDATFTIDGSPRTYVGGGRLVSLEPIVMEAGLTVRMQRVTLQPLFAEVAQLLRGYNAWRAPIEIHRALFNPETGVLIATPHRPWRGVLDEAPIQTPEVGGEATAELTLASATEALTRGLTLTSSDATQSLRGGDRMLRYVGVTGKVDVFWGRKRK